MGKKRKHYPLMLIGLVTVLVIVLLSATVYLSLTAKKNVAGEAIKFSSNALPLPDGIAVSCPSQLTLKSDQNFVNTPSGYYLNTLAISAVNCYGPALINCEYGSIRTYKDLSANFVSCFDNPNNVYNCVCVPK